jgi:hypothetical protein
MLLILLNLLKELQMDIVIPAFILVYSFLNLNNVQFNRIMLYTGVYTYTLRGYGVERQKLFKQS